MQKKAVPGCARRLCCTVLGMAAVSLATPLTSPRIFDKWFVLPDMIYLSPLPILSGVLFLVLWRQTFHLPKANDRHALLPFLILAAIFALGFAGLAWSFYPFVVPDRLTIWQAASATESLAIILAGTAVRAAGDRHLFVLCLPRFRRQSGRPAIRLTCFNAEAAGRASDRAAAMAGVLGLDRAPAQERVQAWGRVRALCLWWASSPP